MNWWKFSLFILGIVLLMMPGVSVVAQDSSEAGGYEIRFVGPVFAIDFDADGIPLSITVRVNASQVQVRITEWTEFTQGRGFQLTSRDIEIGDFVEVSGFFTASGQILAQKIQITTSNAVDMEGTIEAVTASSIQVQGIPFSIDFDSWIHEAGSTAPRSPSSLTVGLPVRLRADRKDGQLSIIELEFGNRTVEARSLHLQGIVVKLEGQLLSLDVGIPGIAALVAIDQKTDIESPLQQGFFVEVEGRFLPGTSLIKAQRIAVDSNWNGNLFDETDEPGDSEFVEIEGEISDLVRETGNTVHFYLNETRIVLNSQTLISYQDGDTALSGDLEEGMRVEVEGTRQAKGSVLAHHIEIEEDKTDDDGGSEDDDSEEEQTVELEGTISQVITNSGQTVGIVVDSVQVNISTQTDIYWESDEKNGKPQLEVGMEIKVKGRLQADGSLEATQIEVKESEN